MSRHDKRQPKGIPVGGEFAPNQHDEASPLRIEQEIASYAQKAVDESGTAYFGDGAIESLQSDGRNAGANAHSYLVAAESMPLTGRDWVNIDTNLYLYGHNMSSDNNVWQPVSNGHRSVMQEARDEEFLRLRAMEVPREIKKRASELASRGMDIGRSSRAATREQYDNLADTDRAIHDGLGLLGARRGYNAIPKWISDYAVKKTGVIGSATRKVLGWLNGKHKTLAILQRTANGEGEKAVMSARLLNLLEHSDKPTQKLIDEIAEKKRGGQAAEADIRAMLARRTHIELARFRSEL